MDAAVKSQLLKSAEKLTEVALDEVIALAEVYAKSTEHNMVDDTLVSGLKSLKSAFIDGLVDKIDEDDEN